MLLLAKIALGVTGGLTLAAGYTFHEGMVRVSVDEHGPKGDHVHLMVPAALIPPALHLAPRRSLEDAARQAGPWMPTVREIAKELRNYPDAELVEVLDEKEHVVIRTKNGDLLIDVDSAEETVHVSCPLSTIEHVTDQIAEMAPVGASKS
jgi:hypothetical protein